MNIHTNKLTKKELELMSSVIDCGLHAYLINFCDGDCVHCRDRKVCKMLYRITDRLDELSQRFDEPTY